MQCFMRDNPKSQTLTTLILLTRSQEGSKILTPYVSWVTGVPVVHIFNLQYDIY